MIDTLLEFGRALAGMAFVLGAWYAIQAVIRRASGRQADDDVLDHMTQGCCGGCSNAGKCSTDKKERKHHHHEPA